MKLKYEFTVREIAGDYILIPVGEAALKVSGMVTTNDVGAFMCEQLKNELSKEELLEKVLNEFEIEPEIARKDIEEFVEQLKRLQLLEEN